MHCSTSADSYTVNRLSTPLSPRSASGGTQRGPECSAARSTGRTHCAFRRFPLTSWLEAPKEARQAWKREMVPLLLSR
jgi:hypothetical protein